MLLHAVFYSDAVSKFATLHCYYPGCITWTLINIGLYMVMQVDIDDIKAHTLAYNAVNLLA